MIALITGASSGIGKEMAIYLSEIGYDLILVARRKERLEKIKKTLKTKVQIIAMDISLTENCVELYKEVKNKNIDMLINNAGFGMIGNFSQLDLTKEIEMIDTNIKAVHILTKLFIKDFIKRDSGYILNVASSAAFMPGPLMATYYASKSYVLRLTEGIYQELKQSGSNVYIGALCPGPVDTEFNEVAKTNFKIKSLSAKYVGKYAVKKMLKKKRVIIPGVSMMFFTHFSKIIPTKMLLKIVYKIQESKGSAK